MLSKLEDQMSATEAFQRYNGLTSDQLGNDPTVTQVIQECATA